MARRPTTARPSGDGPTKDSKGISRWHKAAALVPLALLAGAWSASLGSPTTATADAPVKEAGIPAVPTTSLEQPANYTVPPSLESTTSTSGDPIKTGNPEPSSISVNGIPTAALTAYNRAEQVIAKADPSCNISWALIAAIGRVESDHGRFGGNVLNTDGKATPGIYGLPLDGTNNTALITDTDEALYDRDATYDRAVGPMQFIPGTWDVVGVDGDSDGTRDPQDIDDASLATAVYLCAGDQDLSTLAGQRAAVFSYNHSDEYVALVLSIMESYLDGDYTPVADGLPTNQYIPVADAPTTRPDKPRQNHKPRPKLRHSTSPGPSDPEPSPQVQNPATHNPKPSPRPQPGPAPRPSDPPNSPPNSPPEPPPDNPPEPPPTPRPPSPIPTTPNPTTVVQPVVQRLETVAEATQYCSAHLPGSPTEQMITACGQKLVGKTNDDAAALLTGTLAQVLTRLGLGSLIPETPCLPLTCD